jgi:hypothetical protein
MGASPSTGRSALTDVTGIDPLFVTDVARELQAFGIPAASARFQ